MARWPTSTASPAARRSSSPIPAARSARPSPGAIAPSAAWRPPSRRWYQGRAAWGGGPPGGGRGRGAPGRPAAGLERGWSAPEVAAEFPDLELAQLTVPVGTGPSAPEIRERLRYLSRRMAGAEAVAFRTRPIPQACGVLFRPRGRAPDEQRPPAEAVVVDRLSA